jgi:hypothetical protein
VGLASVNHTPLLDWEKTALVAMLQGVVFLGCRQEDRFHDADGGVLKGDYY